jgi:hypothetical protein
MIQPPFRDQDATFTPSSGHAKALSVQFKAVVGKRAQILPDIPLTILRLSCDRVKGNINPGSLRIQRRKLAVTRDGRMMLRNMKSSTAGADRAAQHGPKKVCRVSLLSKERFALGQVSHF